MKKINYLFSALAFLAIIGFTSCDPIEPVQTATIDFEDVDLGTAGYLKNNSFTSGIITFKNVFTDWGGGFTSWSGYACSSLTDKTTAGYTNDLSVYGNGGESGSKFAVAYNDSAFFTFNGEYTIKDMAVNNGTYAYLSIKNGDSYSKQFVAGDWFKVTMVGYDSNGRETGRMDYYLADFRDGKSYICEAWTKVDLSALGSVHKVMFLFNSTDKVVVSGKTYLNTPAYVCVDDIRYYLPEAE
jgi:hypothetical protein